VAKRNKIEHPNPQANTTWNFKSGATTSWNVDPKDIITPIINPEPPALIELPGGIITPRDIALRTDRLATSRKRIAAGAVYDRDLNILPIYAEREEFEIAANKGNRLVNSHQLSESDLKDAEILNGQYVYLGYLRKHFGHFLLESISRLWAVLKLGPDINVIVHGDEDLNALPSYIKFIFSLLDLDINRITLATRTMVFENLLFPESEFEIRWKGSASYAHLFSELHARSARIYPHHVTPNRVYLTRRQLKTKKDWARMKQVENEEEIENLFASRGFEIVAPETLPLHMQIATIGRARQIAGLKGSALHMGLFSQQPKARLIQLCHQPAGNQAIVNGIKKNLEAHDIGCQSSPTKGTNIVDIEILRAALRAM